MYNRVDTVPYPFFHLDLPKAQYQWLLDGRSMTARLQRQYGVKPKVELISAAWEYPDSVEIALLGLNPNMLCWVRQTQISCHDEKILSARSVIPPSLLKGKYRYLRRLGERSLGNVLFASKSTIREEVMLNSSNDVIERCSIFRLGKNKLLLREYFDS